MEVKLTMYTPEVEISNNAKICYGNKSEKDITGSLVHNHKHLAALRFAYATFSVKDISVACQNQAVRSKHLDFMVQSKRYVDPKKGDFKFIFPDVSSIVKDQMLIHFEESLELYEKLIKEGVKKEDARAILPANTSTSMNITGNLQGFHDFFKLRLNSHAQKEIRELANRMYDLLSEKFPQVFTEDLRKELSS